MAPLEKADLLQGTLDLLILKVVALGPVHGYGISQRIRQISSDVLQVQQGSLYPALHRLEKRGWIAADWENRTRAVRRASIVFPRKGASNSLRKKKHGTASPKPSP